MLPKPELILFDLDGTLVDSAPDLALAVTSMLGTLGRPPVGVDVVRGWVGNGVDRLVKRALTGEMQAEPEAALFRRAIESFKSSYEQYNGQASRLYPTVAETLDRLHANGLSMACITNKSEQFSVPLLRSLGVLDYFGVVISGDSVGAKKPDPEPLLAATRRLGFRPEQTLMVGDSMHDVRAARAAAMPVVGVSYGYNHGRPIDEAEPDAVIDRMAELPGLWRVAA